MRRYWTVPQLREFVALYPHKSNRELAAHFGRSYGAIKNMATKLSAHKTAATIARTLVPNGGWNKGKSYHPKGSERTWFKKGERGPRQRPVGTERMDSDGLMVKVAEPNVWRPKARVVWEQHFGPIPAGAIVRLIDGDPRNVAPENLRIVSRAEHIRLNWKPKGAGKAAAKRRRWIAPVASVDSRGA